MTQLRMAAMANMALANVAVVTDHFQLSAICERKLPKEQLTS